jgi:dUTP pyrophosphatase
MKVKVKKLNNNAVLPYKKYDEDFCYDVVATSCEEVAPNIYKYGLGLAFQIERGQELICEYNKDPLNIKHIWFDTWASKFNLSIDFRPRSSVWETGMLLSNCEGTIDELYTGGVSAVFYHTMPNMPKYEVGDRIGQIKIGITLPMEFVEVDKLDKTARGAGGYGSTGK